ncbi:MAG: DUF167 domain-containing protein [Alphaproteobacteria bacterium]|nr:DUF167 domain-containing protein [Alphaproteobacteria bacterium]
MKIFVKLTPNARNAEVISDEIDLLGARILKVKVNAPPVDGMANEALIELLGDYFAVKKTSIKLLRVLTSRHKIGEINN